MYEDSTPAKSKPKPKDAEEEDAEEEEEEDDIELEDLGEWQDHICIFPWWGIG